MNRTDLQSIAMQYLDAAHCLLQSGHWGAAYYLAGYVVECGLKACIARRFREHDFPDKKLVIDSYTHDLEKLVRSAGLNEQLRAASIASDDFKVNWNVVKDWDEDSRYEHRSEKHANAIIKAIDTKPNGILAWIEEYW